MTTCILCSEDMQRDDDYPSHTHCIFQDVAHRVENSPILLLSYTGRRIKDFQIPNTAEAGILKTIRWYLLFSTDGVPSTVCVGLTFALLWCWFVQIVEPYFLKFGKSISFFLVLSYFLKFGKSISYFLKLGQSMLKPPRKVGEFVFAHVGYFFYIRTFMFNPVDNSNVNIVSTHKNET